MFIRNKHPLDTEVVPDDVSEKDLKDEVLRRNARAGYSTRFGEPPCRTKIMATVNFGKVKYNIWPRDRNGNLIE
jgi:hypothetical protein